ncbi:hypothetical protein MSMEI_2641 [Mycolicibacterium smegmatis MC2 155]|uniref:Uncharacterized protein n=1 Tax=Mycolicibacterium smegmatis (strain ATCC 700084 / mc(2)155) TaxID=246196 RepID=I7G971_MYCS2|nr:hypothetical protein MSMEI_2641 [Mycolicibacterium smegmatis MC2 155]
MHQQQVVDVDRAEHRGVDPLLAARGAYQGLTARTGGRQDHLGEAALVTARDARMRVVGRRRQQPRMFEAHVRQFPQQVVHQHEPPGGGHHRIVGVDPQDVVRGPGGRARSRTDPQRRDAPRVGAAHRVDHGRVVGRGDGQQQVTRLARDPGLGDRIGLDQRHRRERPLAHDHRVDELDRDMVGVRFPLRCDHPQRGAVVELARDVEGRGREVGRQVGADECRCGDGGHGVWSSPSAPPSAP